MSVKGFAISTDSPELRLIEGTGNLGHSVHVPGVLSEKVERRVVLVDEIEIDAVEILSRRLEDMGALVNAALLRRLVQRWKAGPAV